MNSASPQNVEGLHFCYENVNDSCIKFIRSTSSQCALYIICISAVLITILGNLMVVISVAHFRVLHSPTNILVLSLAAVDFLLGVLILPFSTIRSIETCWYFGDDFCRLHTCLDSIICLVSIFHLCFISVDRYYAICDPLHYKTKVTISVVCISIVTSWIFSVVYSSVWLYSDILEGHISHIMLKTYCTGSCQLVVNKIWGWIFFPVFFIPCSIMILLYVKIYFVAQKQNRIIEATLSSDQKGFQLRASKRERKAAKTLGIAVGVYLICWLPFMFDTIIDPFLPSSTPQLLYDVLFWFPYFNSACNPLIYGFFYPWFRKSLKLIATCKIFYSASSAINLYQE
ncbi:trace amine-associated receptor 5-like [Protopterus annectens]|uniref:trace amine-associated receptor 5-like n=1 Tax=Protopterus annectens TaxID=7888 RepID=UPI001CF9D8D3|nr:trace amine-associated receptor 5-like [Protopterus annectens]